MFPPKNLLSINKIANSAIRINSIYFSIFSIAFCGKKGYKAFEPSRGGIGKILNNAKFKFRIQKTLQNLPQAITSVDAKDSTGVFKCT